MNKYQEYQKALEMAYETMNELDFSTAKEGCKYLKILEGLVDQTKLPTEDAVLKEFEELGYYFSRTTDNQICLCTKYDGENIILDLSNYTYVKYDNYSEPMDITLKEHQLLTKLFKALGWYNE